MEKSRIGRLAKRAAICVAMIGMAAIGLSLGMPGFADQPAPIKPHVVPPTWTDSSIDATLADHYAWFNPDVSNDQLLVYLPGSNGVPKNALLFQQRALQLGYHVIGLS